LAPSLLSAGILALNFAAIHTTSFTQSHLIFDLLSGPNAARHVEVLRAEAESALAASDGVWTKKSLPELHLLDSAIRESARLNSFNSPGVARIGVAPDDVTTTRGVHCPKGSAIGIPAHGIHHDPDLYPDPEEHKPFRFSDLRDQVGSGDDSSLSAEDALIMARFTFTATSTTFLPFGHGRHACPGRFFAAAELKLMAAYLLMNYEFELFETRPPNMWMASVMLPPTQAKLRVRRRGPEKKHA
jgi:cytochrome P450